MAFKMAVKSKKKWHAQCRFIAINLEVSGSVSVLRISAAIKRSAILNFVILKIFKWIYQKSLISYPSSHKISGGNVLHCYHRNHKQQTGAPF